MELVIEQTSPGSSSVELVEHKGLGHPDTICDALAETLSQSLSRLYLERFGAVLHHNVDKALLRGGQARPAFGAGEVVAPIEIYLCGRAVTEVEGTPVPIDELAIEGSRRWLREHLHALDPLRHVVVRPLFRPGSRDLVEVFRQAAATRRPLCNDTSFGVGSAPRTPLERAVLATSDTLAAMSRSIPAVGEDVKVLGQCHGGRFKLTVACALIGRHLRDPADYLDHKAELVRELSRAASEAAGAEVSVGVNAADEPEHQRLYLTVTGTSAEAGDDGEVGRGNRVNGLITLHRPMSMEAAAGKNPISHVGKLYNVLADELAAQIAATVRGVREVTVRLVGTIGAPIDDPGLVQIELQLEEGRAVEVRPAIEGLVRAQLADLDALTRRIISGERRLF